MKKKKSLSIIIPIHNEENYLNNQLKKLIENLNYLSSLFNYEILLIENGSRDKSFYIAKKLSKKYSFIKVYQTKKSSYGLAICEGIKKTRYNIIVQFDIDFFDISFLKSAIKHLNNFDIIIGSKLHPNSTDKRPLIRILVTKFLSFLIKNVFSIPILDTHGIKIYKKDKIATLLLSIKNKHHLFETELILRAYFGHFKIKELPVRLKEIRPTRFSTPIRFFQFIKEFFLLLKLKNEIIKNEESYLSCR